MTKLNSKIKIPRLFKPCKSNQLTYWSVYVPEGRNIRITYVDENWIQFKVEDDEGNVIHYDEKDEI